MNGLHILAEFHDCAGERRLLLDADALAALCRKACTGAGLEVVATAPDGVIEAYESVKAKQADVKYYCNAG